MSEIKHLSHYVRFFILLASLSAISISRVQGQVDTDFWFVVPELSHRGNTGGTPGRLRIATLELEAIVTVSMPANPYHPILNPAGFQDIVLNIPANDAAEVDLTHLLDTDAFPNRHFLENIPFTVNGINNLGLHITSTNMINVYWEVNYDYGSDLWTLKGGNGLGNTFYTPFQTVYDNRNLTPRAYSAIDVVASQDNTVVTFFLPPGIGASYGSAVTPVLPGGTHSVTLNAGQTFSLYPRNYSTAAADRLAGTRIESSLPIAVTVKDDALNTGSQGQPVTGDQLVPVDIVGDNYIVPDVKNPNLIFVVATENNTPIYVYNSDGIPIGPSPYTILNQGEQAMVIVPNGSKFARITSQPAGGGQPVRPFYTYQLTVANQTRGGALVPAIGCTGNTQLAFTRARQGENIFYFYIITEAGNEDNFLVDGVRDDGIIDPGAFTPIAGSGGWVAWLSNSINANVLPIGQHLIENTGGIFHLAIMNGFPGAGQGGFYYGYYSDFGGLNVGATVAGTNSSVVRACYGDSVQLHAFGGTTYQWTPDDYLDDATSNLPIAINLPPGAHLYEAEVSGACGSGIIPLTVQVAPPLVAHFETSVGSGCSPLEVVFTDQSEGTYSWQYDMGDGTPLIRYDNNPLTPYPVPPNPLEITRTYVNSSDTVQTYEITLLVKNESGCAEILTKTITVFPEIESDFAVDQDIGCDPLEVLFSNLSTGDTATWLWEFGDGGSSTNRDPIHLYRNMFGPDDLVFDASLVAISPWNCRDTTTHQITVHPYIEAQFAYDTVAECSPHNIIITDQSIGADTYLWDFGDGSPLSTSPGPVLNHTYVNNTPFTQTYTIILRVDNEEGCFHQVQRDVTVYPGVTAAFDVNPEDACSPAEMIFQNNSTGAATYFWEFGDGGSSTEVHPIHRYDRNLLRHDTTFTVMLVATTSEFCRDTAWFDVVLHPYIEAAFTVEDVVGCDPFVVDINNLSIGVDNYYWDFGDGNTSNSSAATLTHTYRNLGAASVVYPLRLIVTNVEGCSDTLIRDITVHPEITANFTTSALEGCHPLTVTFTDLSVNAVYYLWDFGDGAASTDPSPVHTFTNFGLTDTVYTVTLTTSTADGECVKFVSFPMRVYPNVVSEFTFPSAQGCGPFEVEFRNLSIGGSSFTWDFDDGTVITVPTTATQTHVFPNSGFGVDLTYNVSLTVDNPYGCSSTTVKPLIVFPEIDAGFGATDTIGCHPLPVDFTDLSNGAGSLVWDFGDGSTTSELNPSHVFTNTGPVDSVYRVWLRALAPNNICADSFYMDITVHPLLQANFTLPVSSGCEPLEVTLVNDSYQGSTFYWDFGDGSDTITNNLDPFVHRYINNDFNNSEDFEIILVAENLAGCTDEIRRTVTVEPAIEASFSVSQVQGCHPLPVVFSNMSNGAAYYLWDFGNGTTSMDSDPSHTFTNVGVADSIYRVWLYTTAGNNVCRDSFYVDITVHPYIRADFTFQEQVNCSPSPVQFNNASVGGDTFYWDFGDGNTDTTTDMSGVNHVFSNTDFSNNSTFQVTLVAENLAGCSDQITRTVEVYPAIEAIFTPDVDEGCHPLTVDFSNQSQGGWVFSWDFGDGATSEADNPVHEFTNFSDSSITRTVNLLATSQFNCTHQVQTDITIHPVPTARFETERIIDCAPFEVVVENTSLQADTYQWTFGTDTSFSLNNPAQVSHIFDNPGADIATYQITLEASTVHGCRDTVYQDVYVYPRTHADFSVNDGDCSPFMAFLVNESVRGETYLWDFGDGTSASTTDPSNLYFNQSGQDTIYRITLTSTSTYGCVDSYTDSVEVYAQPDVEFVADPTHQMYPDATVDFYNMSNQGYWSYDWNFGDGSSSMQENPPAHLYGAWGEYDIWLRAATPYCSDSVTHRIRIMPPAPQPAFDSVPGACEPYTVNFTNNSIYGVSYLWEFDDGSTSTDIAPTHTFEEAGVYFVKLTVTGPGGDQAYAYHALEVYEVPEVDFRSDRDLVMLPDDVVRFFNMSRYGAFYSWDFGDGSGSMEQNPEHLYSTVGIYDITLEVTSEYGCVNRLTKPQMVTVKGEGVILFPNAFKPDQLGPNGGYYDQNDRELNNIFHPYWEGVAEYNLMIYTRWGEKIFYSNDVNKGWDGYFKGKLMPQDVFVYKSWGVFLNGEMFDMKGDVTLIYHNKGR